MFLDGFTLQLLAGLKVTLEVASGAVVLGLLLGLIFAVSELSEIKIISPLSRYLTSTIRSLPELIILFAIYFGSTVMLSQIFGHYVEVNTLVLGIFALGLIFGSYASQIFRGAYLLIPRGNLDAAEACGFSEWKKLTLILLPQIWQHALPGLSNLWVITLKDSALVSMIGVADLMNKAQVAANVTHKMFLFYMTAALIYFLLTSISQCLINFLEKNATKHIAFIDSL